MSTQHFDVLIIGAGLSGIGMACQISAAFPARSLAILERRERLGGTWDLFRYPGIRSDSDMFTYGYSFRPWNSSTVLADGPSIREYLADTAREFGIDDKIRYGCKIVSADWSSTAQRWTVTAQDEAGGELQTYTCAFLVSATGYYKRWIYRACKRWPRQMRRLLLGQVRRKLGPAVDMQPLHPLLPAVGRASVRRA